PAPRLNIVVARAPRSFLAPDWSLRYRPLMRVTLAWLALLLSSAGLIPAAPALTNSPPATSAPKKVYVLPIRDDIFPPLVYLVRRGVKEAMEGHADLLVIDMETNGGRVDTTREIINILEQFKGDTLTFVNHSAFSAGSFIAVSTKRIFMAP